VFIYLGCVHAAALLLIMALAWYRPALLLLLVPVALSFCYCRMQTAARMRTGVCRLLWDAEGTWTWWRNDGQYAHGRLLGATVMGRHLVILRLRNERHRWRTTMLCLAGDSLDTASHRRLRARLTLWQPAAADPIQHLRQRIAVLWARLRLRR